LYWSTRVLHPLHVVPRRAIHRFQLRLLVDLIAQRAFVRRLLGEDLAVEQAVVFAGKGFLRIFEAEDARCRLPRLVRTAARIPAERVDPPLHDLEVCRIYDVSLGFEFGDGVVSIGRTRVAGDEYEFLIGRPLWVPLQVVVGFDRLVVLVDAEDREVEVVAWIGEVVGIPTKERHLLLGREDEPHVDVLLVSVLPVLRALVHHHDV